MVTIVLLVPQGEELFDFPELQPSSQNNRGTDVGSRLLMRSTFELASVDLERCQGPLPSYVGSFCTRLRTRTSAQNFFLIEAYTRLGDASDFFDHEVFQLTHDLLESIEPRLFNAVTEVRLATIEVPESAWYASRHGLRNLRNALARSRPFPGDSAPTVHKDGPFISLGHPHSYGGWETHWRNLDLTIRKMFCGTLVLSVFDDGLREYPLVLNFHRLFLCIARDTTSPRSEYFGNLPTEILLRISVFLTIDIPFQCLISPGRARSVGNQLRFPTYLVIDRRLTGILLDVLYRTCLFSFDYEPQSNPRRGLILPRRANVMIDRWYNAFERLVDLENFCRIRNFEIILRLHNDHRPVTDIRRHFERLMMGYPISRHGFTVRDFDQIQTGTQTANSFHPRSFRFFQFKFDYHGKTLMLTARSPWVAQSSQGIQVDTVKVVFARCLNGHSCEISPSGMVY